MLSANLSIAKIKDSLRLSQDNRNFGDLLLRF